MSIFNYPIMSLIFFFFFFSSRRRHTRFKCDWSSDVCSSDLDEALQPPVRAERNALHQQPAIVALAAPQPMLELEGLSRGERRAIGAQGGFDLVGMQRLGPAEADLGRERTAAELQPRTVEIDRLALGIRNPDHYRGAVRHQAEVVRCLPPPASRAQAGSAGRHVRAHGARETSPTAV